MAQRHPLMTPLPSLRQNHSSYVIPLCLSSVSMATRPLLLEWSRAHPGLATMLGRMCALSPAERPSISEVLELLNKNSVYSAGSTTSVHSEAVVMLLHRKPPPPLSEAAARRQVAQRTPMPRKPIPHPVVHNMLASKLKPRVSPSRGRPATLHTLKLPTHRRTTQHTSVHRTHGGNTTTSGYVFVKFHKTGSTTLISTLNQESCKHGLTVCNMLWGAAPIESHARGACNAWGGDYARMAFEKGGFGLLQEYFPTASTFVTLMREPVARVWSRYLYNKNRGSRKTLEDVMREEGHDFARTLSHDRRGTGSKALAAAKLSLKKFHVVGITEDFDGFLVLFQLQMGWAPSSLTYQKNKVSEAKRPMALDLNISMTKALAEESELYQYAAKLYDSQKRRAGPAFADSMATFRRAQQELVQSCPEPSTGGGTQITTGVKYTYCMVNKSRVDTLRVIPPCR